MYMYKEDLVFNNLHLLICHTTQPTQTFIFNIYIEYLTLINLQWLICHKSQPNQVLHSNS